MSDDRHPRLAPTAFGAVPLGAPALGAPGHALPRFAFPTFGLQMLGMPQLGHPPLGIPPVEASDPRPPSDEASPAGAPEGRGRRRRWWRRRPPLRFVSAVVRRMRPSSVISRHVDRRHRRVALVRAGGAHREALLQMYREFLPVERTMGLPPVSEIALRAWVDSMIGADLGIVARVEGRTVGHVVLLGDGTGGGELVVLVHPVFRGAHIGCLLVTTALQQARERGWTHVWLVVEPWNLPAVRLYAHAGFQRVSRDRLEERWEARLTPRA